MQEGTNQSNKVIETQKGLAAELEKATQAFTSVQEGAKGLSKTFRDIVNTASLFDDELVKASRNLGQGVIYAQSLTKRFAEASEQVIKIGGTTKDVTQLFQKMSEAVQRTAYFSNETLINAQMLKTVGVGEETIITFNKLFDAIGGTFEEAGAQQMSLVNQAKSYGLNVSTFMKDVASNLTKINQYGFPNGVKDIGEMVAKSKMLGANMEFATSFADRIMSSPETAMDVAAQLQTLGGSFASLGDPMELLYLAQNDLAGLNDKLINATRGLATFNKETGQFEIGVNERLRLKQVATTFGQDTSKIIESATKLAKQEEITRRLDFSPTFKGLSPEQQQLISSYAQIGKGGKVTIEGKGIEDFGGTAELLKVVTKIQGGEGSQFKFGEGAQEANTKMIQANMSSLEKVIVSQNQMNSAITLATIQTDGFRAMLDKTANTAAALIEGFGKLKSDISKQAANIVTGKAEGTDLSVSNDLKIALEGLGVKLDNIKFPALTLNSEQPIKVDVTSQSFNISEIVRKGLSTALKETISSEVEKQLSGRNQMTENPYSSGTE